GVRLVQPRLLRPRRGARPAWSRVRPDAHCAWWIMGERRTLDAAVRLPAHRSARYLRVQHRFPRGLPAVAALAAVLVSAPPLAAQEPQPPVIVTTGTATILRAPDVAYVNVAVESRARTPREAQQQNAAAMAAVAKRLTDLSIPADARKTIGLRLEQEFDNANGRRVPRGYLARNALEVRVDDLARAGEIADAAV